MSSLQLPPVVMNLSYLQLGWSQPNGSKVDGRRAKRLKILGMVDNFQKQSALANLQFSFTQKFWLKETKNVPKKVF